MQSKTTKIKEVGLKPTHLEEDNEIFDGFISKFPEKNIIHKLRRRKGN